MWGCHQGLGDGLAVADGQWLVAIGLVAEFRRDEQFPGYAGHGVQDATVSNLTAQPEKKGVLGV